MYLDNFLMKLICDGSALTLRCDLQVWSTLLGVTCTHSLLFGEWVRVIANSWFLLVIELGRGNFQCQFSHQLHILSKISLLLWRVDSVIMVP